MGRPPKCRRVEFMPHCTFFKPAGIPLCDLEEIALTVEEVEALRLKDLEGLEQEACAERMGISRPTFQRILTSARVKLTEALVEGKAIKVEGGHYQFVARPWRCTACGAEWEVHPIEKPDERCPACGSARIVTVGPGWGRRRRGRHGARP
ncbi:MAG: DUF134 domain-containing protein [Desulfotomaculales bacterium]